MQRTKLYYSSNTTHNFSPPPVKYKKPDLTAIFFFKSETSNIIPSDLSQPILQSGLEPVYESPVFPYFIHNGAFSHQVILVLLYLLANVSVSGYLGGGAGLKPHPPNRNVEKRILYA